ncbi:MAG TPA: AtpZ/AtpI family protein [Bryobacteraceae bacterium]|nr:AtpZ/AtpI family protein [Bryobacteraceae bacterium]
MSKDSLYQQLGKYYGLAFLLPTSILVGYVIGWLLDKLFKTHFLYIVFLLFGVAGGIIELIRELNKADDSK